MSTASSATEQQPTAEQIWNALDAEETGTAPAAPVTPDPTDPGVPATAVTPEPGSEGTPSPDDVLQELQDKITGLESQLNQSLSRLRNAEGHIGGLNKRLKEAQQITVAQGNDAPTTAEINAAKSDPEAMAALKRDYPEFAEAMSAAIKAELDALKQQLQPKAGAELPGNLVTTDDLVRIQNELYVEQRHEGWKERVNTPQFAGWLERQPREVQMLASSPDPRDAVRLLDLYSEGSTKRSGANLSTAAALPSGRGSTRVTQKSLDDMTPEELWRYYDEQDRLKGK